MRALKRGPWAVGKRETSARRRRRVTSLVVAVTSAALALTGCQMIPIDGPVQLGLSDFSQADQPVHYDPDGPAEGATREEIVRGFVRAATSIDDDYAVARQFLTTDYANSWDPSAGVLIEEGGQTLSVDDDDVVLLSLGGTAVVDANGTFTLLQPGSPTETRFELEQVLGEWRISSAPSGVILDRNAFTTLWAPSELYFLTPDNRLVSETRWFLNRPTLSTRIVSEVLDGPSAEMNTALRSAFPEGTVLNASAVPVTDQVAQIDLTEQLLNATPEEISLMKTQLAASLYSVPGVTGFELLVNGVLLDQGVVTPSEGSAVLGERPGTVLVAEADLADQPATHLRDIDHIGERIIDLEPTAVTLSYDHSVAAVRTEAGLSWVSADDIVQIDVRENLGIPSIDRFGYVWSYSASAPEEVLVALPGRSETLLQMPWLDGRTPVAIRISRDGVRAAVLLAEGEHSVVVIAEIVRDQLGAPLSLGEAPNRQMWVTGAPTDLDWIDDRRFAVLSRSSGSGRIVIGSPGNFTSDSGIVADAEVFSTGSSGSRASMRVLTSAGSIYAPQGSGWQRQIDDVELIVKTG